MTFEELSRDEMLVLLNKYKQYIIYNETGKRGKFKRGDIDSKQLYWEWANGYNYNQLGKKYGVSSTTVKSRIEKYAAGLK